MKKYDIVVVGGGFAGVGAAIGAAREGKSVLLIERFGCLGGAACHNLVNPFCVYWRKVGEGKEILNAGVFAQVIEELRNMGGVAEQGTIFNEEYLKIANGYGFVEKILNKLYKIFGKKYLYEKYNKQKSLDLLNSLQCEAHRELFIQGLKEHIHNRRKDNV